jgi:hypothetical protein
MVTILLVYLPALALVLRRSNDGVVPRWLDESVGRASASMHRFTRVAPTLSSTSKKVMIIALGLGMAAGMAAWFYQGFTD